MNRHKSKNFSFTIPITRIIRDNTLFKSQQVGELNVTGKCRLTTQPEDDLPIAFSEVNLLDITIDKVYYSDSENPEVNILPMLQCLPDCKPMMASIIRAAENNCRNIYESKM